LNEDQSLEEGESIANKLKAELGIQDEDLLKGAYMDLLQEKQKSQ
jgi:adenylate cyclase class IV